MTAPTAVNVRYGVGIAEVGLPPGSSPRMRGALTSAA